MLGNKFHLFCIFLIVSFCAKAQMPSSVKFDSYYSEYAMNVKGLSQNSVFSIMQDSRGFIWVGTWDGLNRFDGYSFRIYRPDLENRSKGISHESVNDIVEDSLGFVWVATDKGLNKYDYLTDSFTSYYHYQKNPNSLLSDSVYCIAPTKNNFLWLGTNRGLCLFDVKNNYFKSGFLNCKIFDVLLDGHLLWIATDKGLYSHNQNTSAIQHYDCPYSNIHEFRNLLKVGKSDVYIASDFGLLRYNVDTKVWENFSSFSNTPFGESLTALSLDSIGNVWIGSTKAGVYLYNLSSATFKNLYCSDVSRYGLSNNAITSLITTDNDVVWVGTKNGLNKYSQFSYKFEHITISENEFDQSHNLVWSLAQLSDGNLAVGTEIGLLKFNPNDKSFHFLLNDFFGHNKVFSVFADSDGRIWLGSENRGLFELDENGKLIRHYTSADNPLFKNIVKRIIKDRSGNYWIATYGGLVFYDVKLKKFKNFVSAGFDSENTVSNNFINTLVEDRNGNIWIGTYSGLNYYNVKTKKFKVFRNNPDDENSLSNDRIFSVLEDKDGFVWIGTMGGGLNRYDPKSGIMKREGKTSGLSNNMIYDILEDDFGFLWLTSNKGLIRYNKLSGQAVFYDVSDGVQSLEFNLGAAVKLSDGRIAAGGMNGFNLFYPGNIRLNKRKPHPVFTDFYVMGKLYDRYVADNSVVALSHDENFFSVRFSALDYVNPMKSKYAYRLKNYDKDWIYVSADNRKAEYTDVTPGEYLFELKASNSDGIWNEEPISFTIIVKPPFTQTWLFRLILFVAIALILWFFIRMQVKKIRHKNEEKNKMFEIEKSMFDLEQKALRLQMNPHFLFNSLNSIQSFIVKNDTDKAISYLAKFSRLMRLILVSSREPFISLENEISVLNYYLDLENLRFKDSFTYEIKVDPNIETEFVGVPPMIVQPYVENSVLHGLLNKKDGKGVILVSFVESGDYIICTVEDNGIGRAKAAEYKERSGLNTKSQGISITQERLKLFSKDEDKLPHVEIIDLFDEHGNAVGTKVKINIPYKLL